MQALSNGVAGGHLWVVWGGALVGCVCGGGLVGFVEVVVIEVYDGRDIQQSVEQQLVVERDSVQFGPFCRQNAASR